MCPNHAEVVGADHIKSTNNRIRSGEYINGSRSNVLSLENNDLLLVTAKYVWFLSVGAQYNKPEKTNIV
jgi:hypothetical protein|tara:strand:+ start:3288 stop:3494 length:207 start_codon:yes stop_codon:yes gene_type:complete